MQHIFPSLEYYHHFMQQTTYFFPKEIQYNPHFSIFLYEGSSCFPFKELIRYPSLSRYNNKVNLPFMHQNQEINTTHLTRQTFQEIIIFKKVNIITFSMYTQNHTKSYFHSHNSYPYLRATCAFPNTITFTSMHIIFLWNKYGFLVWYEHYSYVFQ